MPLTPTDVHHVRFDRAAVGKRGYDQDQVDLFVEDVAEELSRLVEENNRMREHLARLRAGGARSGRRPHAELVRLAQDKADAETRVDRLREELREVRAAATADDEQRALHLLVQAQSTVDDHLTDARREADNLLTGARATAENATREARATARALERDVRVHYQEALGPLEEKLAVLRGTIEQLKDFERESRTRLKTYLQSRIQDLESFDSDVGAVDQQASQSLPTPRPAADVAKG